ncbi:MAG: FUSC family protein [Coxiellaceae bacterium]|nr:FUSC family protein [Coxiellaceae bacterium]
MFDRLTRLENAIKVALECVFVALLVEWIHIPYGGIAVVTVLILNTIYYKQSLTKGLQRFAGAAVCSVISIIMITWFSSLPFLYFCSMVTCLSIVFYLFQCNVMSYAMLIGGITIGLLMTQGIDDPQTGIQTAFYWTLCVGIGVFTVWLFDLFWPLYRKKTIEQEIVALIKHQQQDPAEYQRVINLIEAAHLNGETYAIRLVILLKRYFMFVKSYGDQAIIQPIVKANMALLSQTIINKTPTTWLSYRCDRHLETLRYRLHKLRRRLHQQKIKPQNSYPQLLSSIDRLEKASWALNNISDAHNNWINAAHQGAGSALHHSNTKQFQLNTRALKQSSKMTLGIIIMLLLEQFLGWPSGVQGIIAVTVLTGTPNLGRAHWKFFLRVLGVLVGGVIGLIGLWLLSHYASLLFIIALVYFVMGAAAYIALGAEHSSYFGVQMGLMIPLVLLMGDSPTTSMTLPIDRLLGAVLGAVVAACILYFIWPVDPKRMLIGSLKKALASSGSMLSAWRQHKPEDMINNIKSIEQNDRAIMVDSQFLINYREKQQQHHQALVGLLNDYARDAYLLFKAVETLDPAVNQRLVELLSPLLIQAEHNFSSLYNQFNNQKYGDNFKSITAKIEKLVRRVRAKRLTYALNDTTLIRIASIERSLLSLSHTMDRLAEHLNQPHRGAEAPGLSASLANEGATS